jgi:hypothetical protein
MNDPLVHEQAKRFAARVMSEGKDDETRVGRAFVLLYGREPTPDELSAATGYLAKAAAKLGESNVPSDQRPAKAWESLARALFLSNEFVYVD